MENQEPVIVFVDPLSQPARSIHATCKILKIPFKFHQISIHKGENKQAPFKDVNPTHTIPGIQHGELKIGESTAILRYLGTLKNDEKFYPRHDLMKNIEIEKFFDFYHKTFRCVYRIVFGNLFAPEFNMQEFFDKESDLKQGLQALKEFETRYIYSEGKFIMGDEITVCDILAGSEVISLNMVEIDVDLGLEKNFPGIWNWLMNFKQLEEFKEVHSMVKEVTKSREIKYWLD